MRSNTGGSILSNGPTSPWVAAPGSATMGSFGSFALGNSTNPLTPSDKRPNLARGESRLAHLMQKDSSEDISSKAGQSSWRSRPRTDTDPFGDDSVSGSAALGGGQDTSPPINSQRRAPGLDTPVRGVSSDFGMSDVPAFRDSRNQTHQTPQGRHGEREPLSPDTNPYGSPPDDHDNESYDGDSLQHSRVQGLGGIPEHVPNTFGNLPRGFSNSAFDGSDRSQTSSVGASKGFPAPLGGLPSLSNLGGMGGWPTSGNTIGTPDRENRQGFPGAFGNPLFGASGDLQSPSFGAIGGMLGPASSGTNTIGRGSKLGSLFPAAMQAQMQGPEHEGSAEGGDGRQNSAFGTIGRTSFPREKDSPMRSGQGSFEDLFPSTEESRNQNSFSSPENAQGQSATSLSQPSTAGANYQHSQASSDTVSLPATQQRQMVMPDRMKWVYLDPQGQVQGPWSGLEMHDWYKAAFFTADLSVRKVEDTEFEPLGQLIRRIGNSREPFLVPQIGIPHGPPTTQAGPPFTPAASGPGNPLVPVGSVQPPFAGAFPSFGTTLTAEQQNNLERRKQEEQFLMAQQREHLAAQQVKLRQMQMNPASLHHHSSAHSLQSQPSFGSMSSPIGMPPQPPIPSASGFFDGPPRAAPSHVATGMSQDFFREEDINRLGLQDPQQLFGAGATSSQGAHGQQLNQMFGQHPDAQREAARMEQLRQNDPQGLARLREFEQLRAQHDQEEANQTTNMAIGPPQRSNQNQQYQEPMDLQHDEQAAQDVLETPSLTQQIQKAASAKPSPNAATQPDSPWAKVDNSMPMPFPPPPQSTTPLPAPTAQRGRSNLPEALNVDIRSRSETPEVAAVTPSIAPWAKEPTEASKGPSLKDIQEAEAKKAAKAEREATVLRRAQQEQDMKLLSNQPIAPAPGLPTSSTWGSGVSPSTPSTAPSPWATSSAMKPQVSAVNASHKKTLADIQREEELRKQKAAAATAAAQPSLGISGGKRYADLASKASAAGPAVGGPWATVGAGGKVKPVGKIPTGPAASSPHAVRAASSATIPTSNARATARPPPATRSITTTGQIGITTAKDEFHKWAKAALVKELRSDIDGL
jgi:PERQ amino acid-rich with GYF domain-containing protein